MSETVFGRAASTRADTVAATRIALEDARAQCPTDADIALAVVMSSPAYNTDTIVEVVREELGDVPLIGSTTTGEFTDEGVTDGGVTIALLTSSKLRVVTALGNGVSKDLFGTVEQTVEELPAAEELPGEHAAAITFHNGLSGNGEQIALVTNQLLGDVALAGGSAGDDLAMAETMVFTEAGTAADGVAIALLSGDQPFGLAATHGHEPISEPYEVTTATNNVIHELDGQPAYEVWKREVEAIAREEYNIEVDALTAGDQAIVELLAKFELGIPLTDGGHKIRWAGISRDTSGPLVATTEVPEGTEVQIMHSPEQNQIESAGRAATEALAGLDGDPAGALVFDCGCRDIILGEQFDQAVEEIATALPVPFAGFETYGEVCMPPGAASGYHNATTSILLVPE